MGVHHHAQVEAGRKVTLTIVSTICSNRKMDIPGKKLCESAHCTAGSVQRIYRTITAACRFDPGLF